MNLFDSLIINTLPLVPKPIVGFFSRNYIAGPSLDDAVKVVKNLNSQGIMATLDLLGEEVKEKKQSTDAANQYVDMLEEIDRLNLDCNISLKPTHMGLNLDQDFAFENIRRIVVRAKELNNFVRIDMEDNTVTTTTIEMFLKLKKEFEGHVGTVLQAYLKRTLDDIEHLIKQKANLRLCKGIYVEPEEIAYKHMPKINENYNQCIDELLKNNIYTGIATHDEELVLHAFKVIEKLKLDPKEYEFQMLLGVTEKLRDQIIAKGHRLRVYVPYGQDWYQYSIRRLKENPRMAKMIMGKIFGM
ncbi:MAG: proline dehydrogenase [Calditrichaeota bacterium]|nr:MAG: proline dehydrogenase [Calditrichota bacterium]MBL1204849.1 proline dehydrogenase [Calditrichota bacterium]NOG44678.1 proline dehydrogenase [Calditrichota bacterium]